MKSNLTQEERNIKVKIEYGRSLATYLSVYGFDYNKGILESISVEDVIDKVKLPNPNKKYWLIDARLFEVR